MNFPESCLPIRGFRGALPNRGPVVILGAACSGLGGACHSPGADPVAVRLGAILGSAAWGAVAGHRGSAESSVSRAALARCGGMVRCLRCRAQSPGRLPLASVHQHKHGPLCLQPSQSLRLKNPSCPGSLSLWSSPNHHSRTSSKPTQCQRHLAPWSISMLAMY